MAVRKKTRAKASAKKAKARSSAKKPAKTSAKKPKASRSAEKPATDGDVAELAGLLAELTTVAGRLAADLGALGAKAERLGAVLENVRLRAEASSTGGFPPPVAPCPEPAPAAEPAPAPSEAETETLELSDIELANPTDQPPPIEGRREELRLLLDLILDKVSRAGMEALTEQEREFLEMAGKRHDYFFGPS